MSISNCCFQSHIKPQDQLAASGSQAIDDLKEQDLALRLYHPLIVSPLFLYPLPSLISNCLDLPFET